jgi:putative DNA methylase
MNHPVISPKKLIEVALPLDAINVAAAKEKSIRQGHPGSFHIWWARRPLAATRAVIFSQLVNDPEDLWRCQNPGKEPNPQIRGHWTKARARLFVMIEDLVKWENLTNEKLIGAAQELIKESWKEVCVLNSSHPDAAKLFNPAELPRLHDPFAGGGAIPIEAQRLGLSVYASDLNPVAVLINKAMIEIPTRFLACSPVCQREDQQPRLVRKEWRGARGLAEDVRFYGDWMRGEALKKIGFSYPKMFVSPEMVGLRQDLKAYENKELTVIAWIWARTVKSPNPAFSHIDVPLASTFILCSKIGKESYVEPVVNDNAYHFTIKVGTPPATAKMGTSAGKRQAFRCLMSNSPISYEYIRNEGKAGRMGMKLMAVVADGKRQRIYLAPTVAQEETAQSVEPTWKPDCEMPKKHRNFQPPGYGMNTLGELFTPRQLLALNTFIDLLADVRKRIYLDAIASGLSDDGVALNAGGTGSRAYSEAISVYLAFCVQNLLDDLVTQCVWRTTHGTGALAHAFSRQAIPMTWDFPEANPFAGSAGDLACTVAAVSRCLDNLPEFKVQRANVEQRDAASAPIDDRVIVSTDPPYYDNISYGELSDFFYVWLRRSLRDIYPNELSTISVPKAEELIAAPQRHGSAEKAEKFFLDGMCKAMHNLEISSHPALPITIYYAFKQSETTAKDGTSSSGWETFLEALLKSGLAITGTWPMRTERTTGVKSASNVLASSIILVCRQRQFNAATVSRRQFIRELNTTLPLALDAMTRESEGLHSPVAPVDLSQAIIGPGMAVFSKFKAVLEADGSPMSVKSALQLINRFLAEDDFDADTQFCLHWFEQCGWDTGKFGEADTLARAKGTSVDGVKQAGVLHAAGGNVRLLKWAEYPRDWEPKSDQRLPIWEVLHQLIRVFNTDGESGAAAVFAAVQSKAEAARQLAYRLYTLCERKNWAEDARAYNEVVTSWSGIESAAAKDPTMTQGTLFE